MRQADAHREAGKRSRARYSGRHVYFVLGVRVLRKAVKTQATSTIKAGRGRFRARAVWRTAHGCIVGYVPKFFVQLGLRSAVLCGMGNAGADQRRAGARQAQERTAVVPAVAVSGAAGDADFGAAAEVVGRSGAEV